jgi:hypothetical protein
VSSAKINKLKFLCPLVCLYPLLLSFYLPITADDFQLIYSQGAKRIVYGDDFTFSNLFVDALNLSIGWYKIYDRLMGTSHFANTFLFSYILTDFITFKVAGLLSHILCLFLFAFFLKQLTQTSNRVILLVVALIPAFFQYTTSMPGALSEIMPSALSEYFTAHILFFQIILLSFILYARSLNSHTRYVKTLYFLSILLFIAAVNFYEVAFILSPAYILLSLHANNGWKKTIKLSSPYFIISVLAILAWFLAKIIFKQENTYPITTIHLELQTIKSFFYQFISAFPFTNLAAYLKLHSGNILDLIYWYDLLFFLAVGGTSLFLFYLLEKEKILISNKQIILACSLFIFVWLACVLPIALSSLSSYKITGLGQPYPFVVIQMYMLMGLLFVLALLVPSKKYMNIFTKLALSLVIVVCAMGNTLSNKIVIYYQTDQFYLNNNYEYALKNGLFKAIADRQATIIMEKPLLAWNQAAYLLHYSEKIVEVHQSWKHFLEYNKKDSKISNPLTIGTRDTKYSVVVKNNIIEFKPKDNIYYLSVNENESKTNFILSRIKTVELTKEEKPVFYTDKVLIFKINDKKISEYTPYLKIAINIDELKKNYRKNK